MMGDSITAQHIYSSYVEAWARTQWTQWVIVVWFIVGFTFLIVPQKPERFNGADDPPVSFYEVANNTRFCNHKSGSYGPS